MLFSNHVLLKFQTCASLTATHSPSDQTTLLQTTLYSTSVVLVDSCQQIYSVFLQLEFWADMFFCLFTLVWKRVLFLALTLKILFSAYFWVGTMWFLCVSLSLARPQVWQSFPAPSCSHVTLPGLIGKNAETQRRCGRKDVVTETYPSAQRFTVEVNWFGCFAPVGMATATILAVSVVFLQFSTLKVATRGTPLVPFKCRTISICIHLLMHDEIVMSLYSISRSIRDHSKRADSSSKRTRGFSFVRGF